MRKSIFSKFLILPAVVICLLALMSVMAFTADDVTVQAKEELAIDLMSETTDLTTPYGTISDTYADVDTYPLVVFDNKGNCLSGHATINDAFNSYATTYGVRTFFVRKDLPSLGSKYWNLGAGNGYITIDLNEKTVTTDVMPLLHFQAKWNTHGFGVDVKNGTINTAGQYVVSVGGVNNANCNGKATSFSFTNVRFTNVTAPIVTDESIYTYYNVMCNVSFNDCVFENPTAPLFRMGSSFNKGVITMNVTVNGGKVEMNGTVLPTIVETGAYGYMTTLNFGLGSDEKCTRIVTSANDSSDTVKTLDENVFFAKYAAECTDSASVYILAQKTEYGNIDGDHFDKTKYPMALFIGESVYYPTAYGGESGDTVVALCFINNPYSDAVLYFRTNYTLTGSNWWTGNRSANLTIDLGGNTISTSNIRLLYMQSRNSYGASIVVKNGALVASQSIVTYGTANAGSSGKHSEITFENVIFDNITLPLIAAGGFTNGTTMSANIYFNDCTFNVPSSMTQPIFNFGDEARGTINVKLNGGSVNFAGNATSVFATGAAPATFSVNATGAAKTTVTLPGASEDYVLISANVVATGKSVSLGQLIDMNVYIKFLAAKDAVATLECGDRSVTFNVAELVADADGKYKLSLPLTSIMMAKTVTLTIDGGTYTTSIKEYAEELIASDESDAVKALAKALLNYGTAAQEYFAVKNADASLLDTLANAGLADADKAVAALTAEDLAAYKFAAEGMTDDVKFTGATLTFSSKTYMKVYFTASADATVTVNGKSYVKTDDNGQYYVTVTAATPAEALEAFEFVITDGETVTNADISVFTAVHAGLANGTTNASLVTLITAYARYCELAGAYVA